MNDRRRKGEATPPPICQHCGVPFEREARPGNPTRYCTPKCKERAKNAARQPSRGAPRARRARLEKKLALAAEGSGPKWVLVAGLCCRCGTGFTTWVRSSYCSAACRGGRKTPTAKLARREREKGWKLTKARRLAVYERDLWVCQLCGIPVDKDARGTMEPDAPSIDHIVALADGGAHAPDNLQTAHRACNTAKEAVEGRLRTIRLAHSCE